MRLLRIFYFVFLLGSFPVAASADLLRVSQSGRFDFNTGITPFTGPGSTFSYSFDIDRHPVVTYPGPQNFEPVVSNFVYFLDGVSKPVLSSSVTFECDCSSAGGLFEFFLDAGIQNGFYFQINQGYPAFTGPTYNPTILEGTYHVNGLYISAAYTKQQPTSTAVSEITIAAVAPEPSSLLLLCTGVCGTVGLLRRRVAQQRRA